MLLYFLTLLVGIQCIKRIKLGVINLENILVYLIPYWKKGDHEDRILGLLQLGIVFCISLVYSSKTRSMLEGSVVFIFVFLSFVWGIKLLLSVIEWVQEYIHSMTLNLFFSLAVPMIILLNMKRIEEPIEVESCLIALLMSILIIYMEWMSIILGRGMYKATTQSLINNNALKLKSILTWLVVIIVNLYTLLLFIQFYVESGLHPFIEAKRLTKESAVDLFYYLIVTFTTVGFGDISPHTLIAKLVSALIALSGMLFTGIFVGCILNLKE